ncbi:MAG: hypothetical protein JST65_08975 [Acidobacteria bacterium]|nr:hypothetical protein [Acidobacteriota bacterium]
MKSIRLLAPLLAFAAIGFAKDFQQSAPLGAGGRVTLDNYKGSIRISTWDQSTVDVQVHIEADGTSPQDQELVDATEIEFRPSGNAVDIRTRYPKHRFDNVSLPIVRYTIRMPRTAELRVKDYKSDIEIDGVAARLDLETYKGSIDVRHHAGELQVKTYKSEARVEFARYTGPATLETYRGSYDISMPRDAKFDIRSDVGRKGVLQSSFPVTLPAGSSTDGKVTRASVNGGGPALSLTAYRGEFRIH